MPSQLFSSSLDLSLGKGSETKETYIHFGIDASPTFAGSLFVLKSLGGSVFRRATGYTKFLNNTVDQAAITGSGLFKVENSTGEVWLSGSVTAGSASINYNVASTA